MQKNKTVLYGLVFIIALQPYFYSYAMDSTKTIDLAYEATKNASSEGLQAVIGVGSCINLMVNLYAIGKGIKSYISPTEQEQVNAKDTEKELKLMTLRKDLRKCLMSNRSSPDQGPLGVPTRCEEIALMLGLEGATNEATRMAEIFNTFNK